MEEETETFQHLFLQLTTFLGDYRWLLDAYVCEFFTEKHWDKIPASWRNVLHGIAPQEIADDLLCSPGRCTRTTVWPLSLLAFRATAHSLALPRQACTLSTLVGQLGADGLSLAEDIRDGQLRSPELQHCFRRHVKPKKQHEILRLATTVKWLCDQMGCSNVVDVGSGQGHLSRVLSFAHRLNVTSVEAKGCHVTGAARFDKQVVTDITKEKIRKQEEHDIDDVLHAQPSHVTCFLKPDISVDDFLSVINQHNQVIRHDECESERSPVTVSDQTSPCNVDMELPNTKKIRTSDYSASESDSGEKKCCNADLTKTEEVVDEGDTSVKRKPFTMVGLHTCGDLAPTMLKVFTRCSDIRALASVGCCYMKMTCANESTARRDGPVDIPPQPVYSDYGFPMSQMAKRLNAELSYQSRELACHAIDMYTERLRSDDSEVMMPHCFRATLEHFIVKHDSTKRRAGIRSIRKTHKMDFQTYAEKALARLIYPTDTRVPVDSAEAAEMLACWREVVVFHCLRLVLAPVVETLLLLDRMQYLREHGTNCQLVPLFNPRLSPRNFVLLATKH
ncbi:PREDICTED: protein RRNAD1-like [Branchiostoma belcheri]|uniref:Protein RRNAD1-like n=1 Tax=Branchiostoma belcheri TaxID=7741 RepID=A0A6P4ZRV0_BRABE|nr:PREDICTED: protein RRNAD1-like [Branchiostoma belcheri]